VVPSARRSEEFDRKGKKHSAPDEVRGAVGWVLGS
jgi:hypothetical protein